MTREEGLKILKQNIKNQNLIKHCFAVEAIMMALAQHFNEDPEPEQVRCGASEEKWGLAGLLHDIDYETTKDNPAKHSLIGSKMLEELGVDKEVCHAVKVHNEFHGLSLETLMDKCLFVCDPITGLIVASALVLSSKKLADLQIENILNRFKEKAFARGANREIIKQCESLINLSLEEFITISLKAMQSISSELGL